MRNVIFQMAVSLDGYFEGPHHELDWHRVDDEFNAYAIDLLNRVDALLFGRVTYELMASYWPTPAALEDDPQVARRMNSLPKLVFSRTLERADWQNTRLVKTDAAAEVSRLKQQPGKDVAIFGSSDLALALMPDRLINEYRIFITPVVLGRGKPLFAGITERHTLALRSSRVFRSGLVCLTYAPASLV
ncbi:MAG: dihydrofolate reductase [Chloroflexi bacterium]|nr:dihydrofolate reductase [Chloroflexota bacterium]